MPALRHSGTPELRNSLNFVIPALSRDPASSSTPDQNSGIPGQARDDGTEAAPNPTPVIPPQARNAATKAPDALTLVIPALEPGPRFFTPPRQNSGIPGQARDDGTEAAPEPLTSAIQDQTRHNEETIPHNHCTRAGAGGVRTSRNHTAHTSASARSGERPGPS